MDDRTFTTSIKRQTIFSVYQPGELPFCLRAPASAKRRRSSCRAPRTPGRRSANQAISAALAASARAAAPPVRHPSAASIVDRIAPIAYRPDENILGPCQDEAFGESLSAVAAARTTPAGPAPHFRAIRRITGRTARRRVSAAPPRTRRTWIGARAAATGTRRQGLPIAIIRSFNTARRPASALARMTSAAVTGRRGRSARLRGNVVAVTVSEAHRGTLPN
jgi:hypothetical protein